MALVAAGIAADGEVPTPHVMSEIRARDGAVVDRFEPETWLQAMPAGDAATLRQAMVGVVTDGTARNMAIPGVEVGAKTGTAQLGTTPPRSHGWMIAFGGPPGQPPEVAVAVVVENLSGASADTGGATAGPVARAVLAAALGVS
jgi:peptidoglycan glycosyltransferase